MPLHHAASADWRAVRPEIFGTLFEQSLGRTNATRYGAHFTSGPTFNGSSCRRSSAPWRRTIEAADDSRTSSGQSSKSCCVLPCARPCVRLRELSLRRLSGADGDWRRDRGEAPRSVDACRTFAARAQD